MTVNKRNTTVVSFFLDEPMRVVRANPDSLPSKCGFFASDEFYLFTILLVGFIISDMNYVLKIRIFRISNRIYYSMV